MARISFIPRDERFFDLFEQAAAVAVAGAAVLQHMLADIGNAEQYRQEMAHLEHQGDTLIHDVVKKLNRTFVTPLDQEDIRAIASRLDDIIDYTQAAVERIVLYHVEAALPGAIDQAAVLAQTVKEVQSVIGKLRDLRQRKEMLDHCIEINRLENVGDHIYREALGSLFHDGDLLELMRWKEIFEQIEDALDQCEDLADLIESVIVKHS